jgi:hypothetical protein
MVAKAPTNSGPDETTVRERVHAANCRSRNGAVCSVEFSDFDDWDDRPKGLGTFDPAETDRGTGPRSAPEILSSLRL